MKIKVGERRRDTKKFKGYASIMGLMVTTENMYFFYFFLCNRLGEHIKTLPEVWILTTSISFFLNFFSNEGIPNIYVFYYVVKLVILRYIML
ncbi:hypothetical protein IC575_002354 [Cucumis melo]